MRALRPFLLTFLLPLAASAQMASGKHIGFKWQPEDGRQQMAYYIHIHANGTGEYAEFTPPSWKPENNKPQQKITVSPFTLKTLFAAREAIQPGKCETRVKNIAKTGKKTLSSFENDVGISCDFNYADEPRLQAATETFEAIAETMQMGEELARLRRFDRLGLDAEMASLETELQAGRAIEVENIAPTLQAIAEDDRVMDRVRRKAAHLLEGVPAK